MKNKTKNLGKFAQKGAIPWNKGLTKSDPRVAVYVQKHQVWAEKFAVGHGKGVPRPSMAGENHPMFGKHHSEITKRKMSAIKQGRTLKTFGGYKTTTDRRERVKFRNMMQKLIFERDNYTCQLCGVRGVDLQVDHIQSWAEYVELRFSMDNCRTLCAKCHYQITFKKPMPKKIKGWGHNLLKGGELQ